MRTTGFLAEREHAANQQCQEERHLRRPAMAEQQQEVE